MSAPTLTATDGTATVGSVIAFNCTQGRRTKSEMYSSSRASLTVRNPGSIPASWVLERYVTVAINGNTVYWGYITNIEYNYGITSALDTATISFEGYLAFMGRGYLNGFALTGGTTGAEAQRVGNALTGSAKTITSSGTRSLTDTSTYTGAAQNVITTLVAMEQGRLRETNSLFFLGRDKLIDPAVSPYFYTKWKMTDVSPGSNGVAYDLVEFASLTDNYFTQVTISPSSVATQQAGTGSRNLQISTYDSSTTQASNLASYTLNEFNTSTSVPTTVSTRNSLSWAMDPAAMIAEAPIGFMLPITFRGTTYNSIIEGWTISATPEDVRYTFAVSGYEQNNYLILNDAVYGRLDYNKLGF